MNILVVVVTCLVGSAEGATNHKIPAQIKHREMEHIEKLARNSKNVRSRRRVHQLNYFKQIKLRKQENVSLKRLFHDLFGL